MAARRARRATPQRLAKYAAQAESRSAKEFRDMANKKIAKNLQKFAVLSMNELARLGPGWTGEFSASWGFAPQGRTPNTPGTTGKIYKYTKNDVMIRDVERYVRDGVTNFSIINTAPYADIAIDQDTATFEHRGTPIKKPELGTGRPQPGLRYDIGAPFNGRAEEAGASRTADVDWFFKYLNAGGLDKDLRAGFAVP